MGPSTFWAMNDLFYDKLFRLPHPLSTSDIDKDEFGKQSIIINMFEDISLDTFNTWVNDCEKSLTRNLRRWFKRHYLRHEHLHHFYFLKTGTGFEIKFIIPSSYNGYYWSRKIPDKTVSIIFDWKA